MSPNNKRNNPVLISIDTEGPTGKDPVKNMIYATTEKDGDCGINKLMDCFDFFSVKGLFFVDVAEAWSYGEDKIRKVIDDIKERNHDVGMHIHPDHMADKSRRYLWEYSYKEQQDIISKCTEWYIKKIGEHPKYFRAGRYGADNNTLVVLKENGYEYDFSEFYGKKGCKINPPITCNKVVDYSGLIEVPVSTYKSFRCPWYERYDKLDISLNKGEFINIVKRMKEDSSVDVISFFLHSFSLVDWRTHVDTPNLVMSEEKKLYQILQYMKDNDFHFIQACDLRSIETYSGDLKLTDYSGMWLSVPYTIRRAYKTIKMRLENDI